MMKTKPFDPAEYLQSPEIQAELVSEALESGDQKYIAHTLNTIKRARGMNQSSNESSIIPSEPLALSALSMILEELDFKVKIIPKNKSVHGNQPAH